MPMVILATESKQTMTSLAKPTTLYALPCIVYPKNTMHMAHLEVSTHDLDC